MAFRSNGPVTLALPPFRGVTRRLILTAIVVYLGLLVLGWILPPLASTLSGLFFLEPNLAVEREIWRFVTYPFAPLGFLGVLFSLLSLWFFAASLEDERGSRWMGEYFAVCTLGGSVLGSLLAMALHQRGGWLPFAFVGGMWPFVLAVTVAFGAAHPEQPVRFDFILTLKAKYLAAIFVLIYLASALAGGQRLDAVVALLNAGCGYLFLKFAPQRGFRVGFGEWWYGLRNAYYRGKRRRAAKKFTVYMRKQGKEVSLDEEGRYIDPNGKPRDPGDRRWMN